MNQPSAAAGAFGVGSAFQAALASIVTNDRFAARCIEDDPGDLVRLTRADRQALTEMLDGAGPRLMILARLLSLRRFNRSVHLLPATRRLLGQAFDSAWAPYLDAAPAGMPTATEEAVRFAAFIGRHLVLTSLAANVLRYETCLNEVARRLVGRASRGERALPSATDRLRLSEHALVDRFDCDIVGLVKRLREADGDVPAATPVTPRTLVFRPRGPSGVAVDVSTLPEDLADILDCLGTGRSIAAIERELPIAARAAMRAKLDHCVMEGILVSEPAIGDDRRG